MRGPCRCSGLAARRARLSGSGTNLPATPPTPPECCRSDSRTASSASRRRSSTRWPRHRSRRSCARRSSCRARRCGAAWSSPPPNASAICANVHFSFLAQWLWRQIGHVVPVSEVSPFTTPVLTWRVLGLFSEQAFVAAHAPLAGYLRHADEVMRYELAARTAALLEHYLTYRPDWLAAWLAGKLAGIDDHDAARQGGRALAGRAVAAHRRRSRHRQPPSVGGLLRRDERNGAGRAGARGAARRGARLLPPDDAAALPRHPASPGPVDRSAALRAEPLPRILVRDRRPQAPRLARGEGARRTPRSRQSPAGRVGQADAGARGSPASGRPLGADRATPISKRLRRRRSSRRSRMRCSTSPISRAAASRWPPTIAASKSTSATRSRASSRCCRTSCWHSSPARDPPRPSDVLVVTPDLAAAAPLIDAVFGNAPKSRAIPYAITGRPASAQNPVAQALLAVLDVATSRFQASAVFELLQRPIVARRFAIGRVELEAIHGWIRASGIRWGIDGSHRGELGLPDTGRHSFEDGLDRLFLGYALPASATVPVNERLAAGDPEGSATLALGSFREFVRQLERLHAALARPKSPADWRHTLLEAIDSFLAPAGDEIEDERETAERLCELHASMASGGMDTPLDAAVVRTALTALLDDPTRGGMPGGEVTFAAMASLRNLPYRFVCAIGLNDGAFPSTQRAGEFDLMARHPRRGDRQRRIDERNVFLDLLLAARERLYLSYTGKSVRDNSPLPPSVLVAELLDYCAAAIEEMPFSPESLTRARKRLIVEHPLQSFSIDYFKPDADARARSFNVEYCDALKQRLDAAAQTAPVRAGDGSAGRIGSRRGRGGRGRREGAAAEVLRSGIDQGRTGVPRGGALQPRSLLSQPLPLSAERTPRHHPPARRRGAGGRRALRSRLALARRSRAARAAAPARRREPRRVAHLRPCRNRISDGAPGRRRAGAGIAATRPLRARTRSGARGADARSRRRDARIPARRRAVAPDRRASATCASRDTSAIATTTRAPGITSRAGWSTCSSTPWRCAGRRHERPGTRATAIMGCVPSRTHANGSPRCSSSIAQGCSVRCISSRNPHGPT